MAEENSIPDQLEGGAYEVIRARLEKHGSALRASLDRLNTERLAVFGGVQTALLGTERIATEHNCVARDLVTVGKHRFLFGYNIQFGLKQTTEVQDVFSVYDFNPETKAFTAIPVTEVLDDPRFTADFTDLYKYYRETVFQKFLVIGPHLFLAMRAGKTLSDIKVFKWRMTADGLEYVGSRFDHEYVYPKQHEFEWTRAHRGMHRSGLHPHISIEDRVFIETVGGDLTVKVEDNTESGEGIYAEPVTESDQTLDDAEIFYACVGSLILLKVLPYRESLHRYLVFNEKTRTVHRLDAIGDSCVLLPDDHGIVFANGYLLQSGELKTFDHGLVDMRFERRVASSNGEDVLFSFYNRPNGEYVLLSYNRIQQGVDTPILCSGFSLFGDGELVLFRTDGQPQKHHSLQIWQTPYLDDEAAAACAADPSSYLFKIGNAELVRGMAESRELLTLLQKDDSFSGLYLDLAKRAGDLLDTYFWLDREECGSLAGPLREIKKAAESAIGEFEKVQRLRETATERTAGVRAAVGVAVRAAETAPGAELKALVEHLSTLRKLRGEIMALGEVRYTDPQVVEDLEKEVVAATAATSQRTVDFLLGEDSLRSYAEAIEVQEMGLDRIGKVTEADEVGAALDRSAGELEMLIEIVGGLKIADATQTTAIIERISALYAKLNGTRGGLRNRRKELARGEGEAQFSAQMKLLSQALANYLDLCDTPERCDESLTRLMVQVEELEGRFSEFDEYILQLAARREEIYDAFEGRRTQLMEARQKRAGALFKSAERILNGIRNRLAGFKEIEEVHSYFATDPMIEKVRDIVAQLSGLGDPVKADDLQTRLKTLREDGVRQLKDKKDLFVDGQNVLRFGKHAFSVNTQPLEPTIVPFEDGMAFHLAGTKYFERIEDPAFLATREAWDLEVPSEGPEVARVEYLAWQFLRSGRVDREDLLQEVQAFMQPRYAEGYTKGVHDEDAAKLLEALLPVHEEAGLLRFGPRARAAGILFWDCWEDSAKLMLAGQLASYGKRRMWFREGGDIERWRGKLQRGLGRWLEESGWFAELASVTEHQSQVVDYLVAELSHGGGFVVSASAAELVRGFEHALVAKRAEGAFADAMAGLPPEGRFEVVRDWLSGFQASSEGVLESTPVALRDAVIDEASAHLARGGFEQRSVQTIVLTVEVDGLRSGHARIEGGRLAVHYSEFLDRLSRHEATVAVAFRELSAMKQRMIHEKRSGMRLDEFKPKVMSAFVRNRLIDEVYLPLIGDNLAKQLGTAGVDTRTDRMGMLLLISPPGYGKTTLMEYVADRLGLTFVKINGPALGHHVLSLDPTEAPNAAAREEVIRLNLALEMGDNVMLYVDDIQHTNPEFLQKFISLCDAQRKIEGVWKGRARTYDLRGRKVAVVMAGNPYTESGGKFQIPDMLANRADTYNLGDILGGHEAAFKSSYIENALTSNAALSRLASRSQKDVLTVIRMAETGSRDGADFEGNYTPAEIDEMVTVTRHLLAVRDTILRVNLEYIRSAAQEDAYRTEPSFKLQGSYRNMNRIAEKVLPLMTAEEVQQRVDDHYRSESQNLTKAAEANLLKFYELEGRLQGAQEVRWEQIKKDFVRHKLLGGAGETDPVARVVAQLTQFNDGLSAIHQGIAAAGAHYAKPQTLGEETVQRLQEIIAGLRAVPVEVDIKVVPVQDEEGTIEKVEKSRSPLDVQPEIRQLGRDTGGSGAGSS
ncbi:phage shock protein A [Haloferula luteola]|uniref:Phage shock protein A n=1 Tax=Haloferula luteola TaxID=595692 RepID=A0A840UVA5_9BACT|nr:DNA repair ATPase [Haloferula luteola]MBB5350127.1 phage shock protein A [Haloferula luteola]